MLPSRRRTTILEAERVVFGAECTVVFRGILDGTLTMVDRMKMAGTTREVFAVTSAVEDVVGVDEDGTTPVDRGGIAGNLTVLLRSLLLR